jgi:GxxExxY protein
MAEGSLEFEKLTESVIGGFFKVYNHHGFGFLENPYANSLELELKARGHRVDREVSFVISYLGTPVGLYKCDMIIDESVIVEIKAGSILDPTAKRQLFNYLRASGKSVGLLFHFGPVPKVYRQICTPYTPRNPAPRSASVR